MLSKAAALLAILHLATAKVQYAGVNIAGFDFGCDTSGNCPLSGNEPPLLTQSSVDGVGQMKHFVSNDGLNIFRLPVSWQYLVNNQLGGTLNSNNAGIYDELVGACLNTGAHCVIDIHNYARWNGQIIGQSGGAVTNAQFSSLWSQLAAKYKGQNNVIFGVMNEPHDLDVGTWATTVQQAVTAIRNAGASSQMILLPGSFYTAVGSFSGSGGGPQLAAITNPDGSKTNLIFDVHQYLDSDGSGTSTTCTNNGVTNLSNLATWLRSNGRKALLSETGGGSTSSCYTDLCGELDWMNYNTDVYLGWIGWAAGSFNTGYALSETPTYSNGVWTDTGILKNCVAGKFTS